MPISRWYFFILTLSLNFSFAAQTETESVDTKEVEETTFQRIVNTYSENNIIPIRADTSLLIKLSNQHSVNYGRVLLLTPINREPGQLDIGHSIQTQLPKLGWDLFLYYHHSKDNQPASDDYQSSIQQAIVSIRQQSEQPLVVVAFDQASIATINLAAKEAPNIDALALIIANSSTEPLEYPSSWSTPILIIDGTKESNIPIELKKVASGVIHKRIAHGSMLNSSGSFISHHLHGWFKKIVQSN